MKSTWLTQIEKVQQVTKLKIELFSCALKEWENVRQHFEDFGGEIVQFIQEDQLVHYIGIQQNEWPATARSMLALLFPAPQAPSTVQGQLNEWLQQVWEKKDTPPPASLATKIKWTEPRVCFVMERATEHATKMDWKKLLRSFFPERTPFVLSTLSRAVSILLVPVSVLLESVEEQMKPEEVWLEWAFSLHELLTAEASETVRIITAPPVVNLPMLGESIGACQTLLDAVKRYFPEKRVGATWQNRLEQWIVSLSDEHRERLFQSFPIHAVSKLTQDQIELLDELFRQNLNSSETARSLFIHRNTLIYRLDKITEQTGLDPRIFMDAVLLRLWFLFRQND